MKRLIFTLTLVLSFMSLVVGQGVPGDSLILFHDSSDPRFYDQSVVTQTAPSTVVTEAFTPGGANGDKLPAVTTPVKDGANALKLQWNSGTGGAWTVFIASVGWLPFDVTTMSHLRFWVNSTAALDTAAMPMIYLEAVAGTPKVTGKVRLANYVTTGLMANTWTQVSIPLADLWAKDLLFTAKDNIKGVYFSQGAMDNMEHTLYLDEFTFSSVTGISNPLGNNNIKAYFYNGEIRLGNYEGRVRVYDLIGRLVGEGDVFDGTFSINLNKGIYIVSTSEGNAKIVID